MQDAAVPHYVTLAGGQLRLWQAGSGPDLAVLAGPTLAASVTASLVASACPGWRVTVVELPGIGGSALHAADTVDAMAEAADAALAACGIGACALASLELAAPVARHLAARRGDEIRTVVTAGAARACGWARAGCTPGDLAPRQDGTHLTALWSFLRDRHLLVPDDPTQPATDGEDLPDADALAATVTAAAVRPERFAALWNLLAAAIADEPADVASPDLRLADLAQRLAGIELPATGSVAEPTQPARSGIWHQYVETSRGRMHLRRAGSGGRPTLVIPTGGGSSSQFAPIVTGLAEGDVERAVFAVDYLGNGLSDKPAREGVSTETLAEDMLALIDALGHDEVDVWGSHTGALVGLELAVRHPERVGRLVMEGPVFISPDFQSDLLSHYFPRMDPDRWGLHLPLIWNWRRDMFMYWPWYRVERGAARQLGVPSAEELHLYAIGIMESGPTYDHAYRSAFAYDTRSRMPHLTRPALVCAGPNDMLANGVAETEKLGLPGITVKMTPTTVWWPDPEPIAAAQSLKLYRDFLDD